MPDLPWSLFGQISLVAAIVILILTGKLTSNAAMPRATVELMLKDKDTQIADWRGAWRDQYATMATLTKQNDRLLEQGETTLKLLQRIVDDNKDVP